MKQASVLATRMLTHPGAEQTFGKDRMIAKRHIAPSPVPRATQKTVYGVIYLA